MKIKSTLAPYIHTVLAGLVIGQDFDACRTSTAVSRRFRRKEAEMGAASVVG